MHYPSAALISSSASLQTTVKKKAKYITLPRKNFRKQETNAMKTGWNEFVLLTISLIIFFKTASKDCSKSTHQQCWWSNGCVLFLFVKRKTPFPAPEPMPLYFTTREMVRKMILIYIISKKLLFVTVVTGLAT